MTDLINLLSKKTTIRGETQIKKSDIADSRGGGGFKKLSQI